MVKDTYYYDVLEVQPDVQDKDLKKAYRKKAMQFHPDKNKDPGAEEKFKEISIAYQMLSDPDTREVYDRHGRESAQDMNDAGEHDAADFFAATFGGARFNDLIGQLSMLKDLSEVSTRDAAGSPPTYSRKASLEHHDGEPTRPASPASPLSFKGRLKMSPEEKKRFEIEEARRRKERQERVDILSKKLIERIRPFVEAVNPGIATDPETIAFTEAIKQEAEHLKLESFGIELLHTIGNIYMAKATVALKSKEMLGIPGFFARVKDKGSALKDAWSVLNSAVGVQMIMDDMAKKHDAGEAVPEVDLHAIQADLSGRILLASWRSTRYEVSQVLREVCDKVLTDPDVSEGIHIKRAKAIMLTGALFKAVEPDESDEERRELEQ
ncbi:hypothetical protein FRB96_003893 [Tulasnella sp. 330]|nr:hypothetical protein FRB96_003893 [Tulasnella sp. 330]